MRAGAVGHEQSVGRPLRQGRVDDLSVRKVDRSRHMPGRVMVGAAHIEKHKTRLRGLEREMRIPAVRLKREAGFEVYRSRLGRRCGDRRDWIIHGHLLIDALHACSIGSSPLADLTYIVRIMPKAAGSQHLVAAIAHDRLGTFEYGIAAEIFGQERPEMGSDWYRFITVGAGPGPLRALGGMSFEPEFGLDALKSADTIVIPGWTGVDVPVPPPLIAALRDAHERGARLVSICSGAFVLAATGLLDGLIVTTHWHYADLLAARYPAIRVNPDVLYVDNSPIFTSAGSAAGIDLLLYLVRLDHGAEKANSVARCLVMSTYREGGQAQFIERPVPLAPHSRLAPLLDTVRRDLSRPYRISDLARAAVMSERTFIRRFRKTTGMTPGEWLVQTRLKFAKEQLEASSVSIDEIANLSGFFTVETMRHHFRKRVGLSPREYRQRFGHRQSR